MMELEDVESYLKSIEVGGDNQMYQVDMVVDTNVNMSSNNKHVPMLSPQFNSNFSVPVEDLYSPYDTEEFPTSLDELLKMDDLDIFVPSNNSNNYSWYKESPVVTETLYVPVIEVSRHQGSQDQSQYSSASNSDSDDDYIQQTHLSTQPRKSRIYSGSSAASCQDSESEDEWRPEEFSPERKSRQRRSSRGVTKNSARRKSKTFSHKPIPQKRAPGIVSYLINNLPFNVLCFQFHHVLILHERMFLCFSPSGTSLKITQWIVSLLRDPACNPSVITWQDEAEGVFSIRDSDKFARLWGEVKHNPEMNYEKLSRAMRYSYKNAELEPIREKRLTYKFGPNMIDWEPLDKNDPNFDQ